MKKDYHGGFVVLVNGDTTQSRSVVKRFLINGTHLWDQHFDGNLNDLNAVDENGNIFVSSQNRFKLDLNGNHLWPDTLVGPIPDNLWYDRGGAFPDGMGGVIGARWNTNNTVTIKRADSTGNFVFANPVILSNISNPFLGYAPDNEGGIYISVNKNGVKIQRIGRNGQTMFDSLGISPCANFNCGVNGFLVADNSHGAISIWTDTRGWPNISLYAQRVDSNGSLLWDSTGAEFHTTSSSILYTTKPLYSDGRGGALFVWDEFGIYLKQISLNGNLGEVVTTGIKNKFSPLSENFGILLSNFPNPFNSSTTISFNLPRSGKVELKVFNILGQEIITLLNTQLPTGNYKVDWDGKSFSGKEVASGIYIYTLIFEHSYKQSKKMLLIK
ncbi:MAG: T9SS C-terminal target domain-containing protein [Methanobacteriota archaeon]|nr:MAG: T9SS C-terminal target domain-containing protein [Euryarchaeota archaeon]